MDLIEKNKLMEFTQYLVQTGNNICGKHSIQLLMSLIEQAKNKFEKGKAPSFDTKFVHYTQSVPVRNKKMSSVSFASAYTTINPTVLESPPPPPSQQQSKVHEP